MYTQLHIPPHVLPAAHSSSRGCTNSRAAHAQRGQGAQGDASATSTSSRPSTHQRQRNLPVGARHAQLSQQGTGAHAPMHAYRCLLQNDRMWYAALRLSARGVHGFQPSSGLPASCVRVVRHARTHDSGAALTQLCAVHVWHAALQLSAPRAC
eukprot:6257622-Prorocentrum_lima.AAC.1